MRKLICFITILLFLLNTTFIPCYAIEESFVTKAINAVESKIEIPANYTEFNSKLTVSANSQLAYLTWYGEENEFNPGGQISVTVDDKMRIISFGQYFYGDFKGNYKLSEFTSDDAKKEVESFLAQACPEFYYSTKFIVHEYSVHRKFEPYSFKLVRYENDLPCYDNYIDVEVDSSNGKVKSYNVVWTDYDKIYTPKKLISADEASVAMYDKIGMLKEFAKKSDGSLYIRYTDLSDGVNFINAYTGNILNSNYISQSGTYKNAINAEKVFDFWYSQTEYDLNTAIEVVENCKYIPLPDTYQLTGIQYLEDDFSNYIYMVYEDDFGSSKLYIVDVNYKDIRFYDYYQQSIGTVNYGYNALYCRRIAELFVKNYEKSFALQCELLNYNTQKNYNGEEIYYYNFTRLINNIAYDSNGIVIGVSGSTGEVVSVRSGWENIDSYNFETSVSKGQAFEKYINAVGLELQYVTAHTMTKQKELRVVYAPNPLNEFYIDGITGELIDKNGEMIAAEKKAFTDISTDISKEQIITLNACGILDSDEKFNPNEYVLLCDYLLWMCRAIDCKDYNSIDDVAEKLVNRGIVTYEQLALNDNVNTETAIKYIICYLGYGDVAVLPDTFKTGFLDEGMISTDMIGYAAIAKGLKIFQGNAFMPKEYTKRNVAAQILYNLISN